MIICLEDIVKSFPGTKALDRVSFDIYPGEVHALCGENGAGKTTLMKILAGIWPYSSYQGRILKKTNLESDKAEVEELRFNNVSHAKKAGIAIVHQELALIPEMSVIDNLFLGSELSRFGVLDKKRQKDIAIKHFNLLDFSPNLDSLAKDLSIAAQQRLEIARTLLDKPAVLILDEPTSSLSENDALKLLNWIRKLANDGTACVYISHRIEEVLQIADRITVLRDGRSVWTKPRKNIKPLEVIEAMVDRPPQDIYAHMPQKPGKLLCQLKNVQVTKRQKKILEVNNLDIHVGEIVGLAGMMGAGRTCLLHTLNGSLKNTKTSGDFFWHGKDGNNNDRLPKNPIEAMAKGIFLIPEDRKNQALFLEENLTMNISCATILRYKKGLRIDTSLLKIITEERMKQFAIKAPGTETVINTLSGGNQQKTLLARAREVAPSLLLLDEPTRGIDVGAKESIYRQMETWVKQGWAILWSSSELQELLGISDRVYVIANGKVKEEFNQRPFNKNEIMAIAATG